MSSHGPTCCHLRVFALGLPSTQSPPPDICTVFTSFLQVRAQMPHLNETFFDPPVHLKLDPSSRFPLLLLFSFSPQIATPSNILCSLLSYAACGYLTPSLHCVLHIPLECKFHEGRHVCVCFLYLGQLPSP